MPTYYSLADQGFYEPFKMLQRGLSARADRQQREREIKQQKELADRSFDLSKKQIESQLKLADWKHTREKKAADREEALRAFSPTAFTPQVTPPTGFSQDPEAAPAQLDLKPDITKPLYKQTPAVQAALLKHAKETGVPIEDYASRWESTRAALSGPPAPVAPPSIPGYRAESFTVPTETGPVTYGPKPVNIFGDGGVPDITQPLGSTGMPSIPGMAVSGVNVNAEGVPSISLKPTGDVQQERMDSLTKTFITSKPFQTYDKSRQQWTALNALVQKSRKEPSGADDMGIVFTFMKTLDPDSVVRESEFRSAASIGSLPEKIAAWRNSILRGEFLPAKVREDMLGVGTRVFLEFKDTADDFRKKLLQGDFIERDLPGVPDAAVPFTPGAAMRFKTSEEAEAAAARGQINDGDTVLLYDPRTATYKPMQYYK